MSKNKREYPGESLCRFHMCGERVLMVDYQLSRRVGRIVLPDGCMMNDLTKGKIVAVGPEVKVVKVGDVVIHVPELGTTIVDGDVTYRQLPENACIAIDSGFSEDEIETEEV